MTLPVGQLIEQARQASNKAYAPYSSFFVGAALLLGDGTVVTGCNVENASYGLTVCAERTAICKAVSEGRREFEAIAVYADTDVFCSPCGACRQVIAEFGPQIRVIMANRRGEYKIMTIAELLPETFKLE